MMMNNADPVLRDVRVRQAIALAIDRPPIIGAKLSGRAVLATGLLAPSHWAYSPDVPRWTRDLPARARCSMPRASVPTRMASACTSCTRPRPMVPRRARAHLRRAARPRSASTSRSARSSSRRSSPTSSAARTSSRRCRLRRSPIPITTSRTSTPSASRRRRIPDTNNRWRYRNAEVDRLTLAGRRELDVDKRKAIYAEVQRIVAEEVPIIPLWHEDVVVLSNASVEGYTIVPNARLAGLTTAFKRVVEAAQ